MTRIVSLRTLFLLEVCIIAALVGYYLRGLSLGVNTPRVSISDIIQSIFTAAIVYYTARQFRLEESKST